MRCVTFQLQISVGGVKGKDVIHSIDKRAPCPCPLEGGDGLGVLWQCILDSNKVDLLIESMKGDTVRLYSFVHKLEQEVEESLYNPENLVVWRMGKEPAIEVPSLTSRERTDSCVIC